MAEDDDQGPDSKEQTNDELISGLEQGDIKPNFYEGGFKTWECALDLARCVIGDGYREDWGWRFIEVGLLSSVFCMCECASLLLRKLMNGLVAWCWHRDTVSGSVCGASVPVSVVNKEDAFYFCGL